MPPDERYVGLRMRYADVANGSSSADTTPPVVGSYTFSANIITKPTMRCWPGVAESPAARLGAATWTDARGTFWLFGGSDGNNFLNDLWKYYTTAFPNPTNYQTTEGTWTWSAVL